MNKIAKPNRSLIMAFALVIVLSGCGDWNPFAGGESAAKEISAYSFASLTVNGVISKTTRDIAVTVPSGTSLTALVATFSVSDKAKVKVGTIAQTSGVTANDFSSSVKYAVTAEDGTSVTYTVTVTVEAPRGLIVPSFYQGFSAARTITVPVATTYEEIYKTSVYPCFSPALARFEMDTVHSPGDVVVSSFVGTPLSISTQLTGSVISYHATDDANSVSIEMTIDTETNKVDYHQTVILFMPANTIGSNLAQYMTVFVDMVGATLGADLSLQSQYDLLYYRKDADGSSMVFKVANTDFYTSANLNGFAYYGADYYQGIDFRPTLEIPTTLNGPGIKTACLAMITGAGAGTGFTPEYNSMWFNNSVYGNAGAVASHQSVSEMISTMPWVPVLQ